MSFKLNPPPDSPLARHRQLAPSAAIRVSPLCLGTMTFGTANSERYGQCSKEDAFGILDHFYSHGGNFIDTANTYRNGQSEEWLGEWMASRGNRDEIVLATKYSSPYQTHFENKLQSNYGGNNVKSLKISVESSLARLQTNYIDLLYVHCAGKVLYLGISDTPAWVVAKANQYARSSGLRQFVVYQGFWNATLRDFERDIIPMCRDEGMGLAPYGVLNQGRFQTAEAFKEREKGHEGRNFIPLSERDKKVSAMLEEIANRKGVDLLHVALAYVLGKAPYVFPIIGARKVSHLEGSIPGLSVSLTDQEIDQLEGAYEFDHGFPHTFISGSLFDGSKPRPASNSVEAWHLKLLGSFDWVEPAKPIAPKQD